MYVGRYGYMCVFASMWVGGVLWGGWPSPSWGGGGDHQTLGHMYIYICTRHGHKLANASPCIFRKFQSGFFRCHVSLVCNSSSIHLLLGQPFGNCFCTIYQLLLVALAIFFYIDIFSSHYSGFVVFNTFLKADGEALHSLFYISYSEFAGTSTKSAISYLVSECLVWVAVFSCLQFQPIFYFIDIFSRHIFLDFSHFTPR